MGSHPEIGIAAPALFHFWSAPAAQRVRLALAFKRADYLDRPLDYFDDETFFALGVQRTVPVLAFPDGRIYTDAWDMLWRNDLLFPGASLVQGCIDENAWQALIQWRERVDAILQRLHAPAAPAYREIGAHPAALAAYKSETKRRFGMTLEELANDRYAGYTQLERETQLKSLARHLATNRFYTGRISIADLVLTADLYPLQLLDGIALPIDLLYYFRRVLDACGASLNEGLIVAI